MSQKISLFIFRVSHISPSAWGVMALTVVFFSASHYGRMWVMQKMDHQREALVDSRVDAPLYPQRIIALAPSNVETLFAMGLGDKVVGISRFTSYPPEALSLPKVAGYVEVDMERLVSLRPDCVVMVESQREMIPKFDELGIRHVSVDHASLEGVVKSFQIIAKVCGNEKEAERVTQTMRSRIDAVKKKAEGRERLRVLVCIHHEVEAAEPTQVIVAGNSGFHQDLISVVGGVNAYQGTVAYPKLSREKLIQIDPDVIILLMRSEVLKGTNKEELLKKWQRYRELKAVRTHRVYMLFGNEHFVPGPRTLDTLDAFSKLIWGQSGVIYRKGVFYE